MRSELVAAAAGQVRNRYLLVHVATRLTRVFHRAGKARVPQSINDSLAGLAEGRYLVRHGRLITEGVLDLDTFNGISGEAQCSYVLPEYLTPEGELKIAAETA